jgi:DNA-binding NarL/FixJ family response regulator
VTTVTEAPAPIPTTGDPDADAELAGLRDDSQAIAAAQALVIEKSRSRQRRVLWLRERGVLVRIIADAVPTTEQTIHKIQRDAREARERGEL